MPDKITLTPEMLPVLKAYSEGKLRRSQVAAVFGIGRTTVTRLLKEAGYPSSSDLRKTSNISSDLVHNTLEKVRSGEIDSYVEAGKELGITDTSAKKLLREHGLEIKYTRELKYYPKAQEGIRLYKTWKLRSIKEFMAFVGCGGTAADRMLTEAGARRGQGAVTVFMCNPEAFIAAAEVSEVLYPTPPPRTRSRVANIGPKPRICNHPDFELAMQRYASGEISSRGVADMLGCSSEATASYLKERGIYRNREEAKTRKHRITLSKLRSPEMLTLTNELIKIGEQKSTGGLCGSLKHEDM